MSYVETNARYENTTMREIRNNDGNAIGYDIAPIDGYVLHNSVFDKHEYDPKTQEKGELISLGYSPSSSSVGLEYDFDENPSEIYAVEISVAEENGIIY